MQRCNDVGDAIAREPCGSLASCVVTSNEAICLDRVCKPDQWTCDVTNLHAELCSADGDGVVRRIDCAETGEVCLDGSCAPRACVPGERHCTDEGVLTCNDSGSAEALEPCTESERCDVDSATCIERVCEPGALDCDAETVTRCNDDGSANEPTALDCAEAGESCWVGACSPRICHGEFVCREGVSIACVDNGTRLEPAETCGFELGTFCNADSGRCESFACQPGQPVCNGDLATRCADDGSGPRDVGVDCSAASKLCWDGECLPQICSDLYRCDGQDLIRCVANGTGLITEKTCGAGTACDAEQGTCRRQKCVPSQPACNGSLATTCDATGLGYEGQSTDCGLDERVCVDGTCLSIICEADAIYCSGDQVRRCGPSGATFKLLDTCADAEFCLVGESACIPDECSPGSPYCAGTRLTTCAADGSGPEPGGVDCALADQVCDLGECRTLICSPNTRFCFGSEVRLCNGLGTAAAAVDICDAREFCDEAAVGATACAPDLCIANGPACLNERLATCNADGSGASTAGTDCSASRRICDLSGACASEAFDVFGEGDSTTQVVPGYAVHFVLLRSLASRSLVEVEAAVTPGSSEALAWVVYRASAELGPYTRLSQVSGAPDVSSGYVASGPLGASVASGQYYLIGVGLSGTHEIRVPAASQLPHPVSFGQVLGGYTLTLEGGHAAIPGTIRVGVGEIGEGLGLRVTTQAP